MRNLFFRPFFLSKENIFLVGLAKFPGAVPVWWTDSLGHWICDQKFPQHNFPIRLSSTENFREVTLRVLWLLLSRLLFPKSANRSPEFFEHPIMGFIFSFKFQKTILHYHYLTNLSYVFCRYHLFPFLLTRYVLLLIHYFRWDKRCMKIEDLVEIQIELWVGKSTNILLSWWQVRN